MVCVCPTMPKRGAVTSTTRRSRSSLWPVIRACTGAAKPSAATFFFSSRRRQTRCLSDWSSDVCSSDLREAPETPQSPPLPPLLATHSVPGTSYPHPSSRYAPYPDRPAYEQPPSRRYSQTLSRDFPQPTSPTYVRSPTTTTRPPPIYPPDPYSPYAAPPYGRGVRRS